MGFDGYTVLAILTLFFVYLLPSLIRSAQVVAEARIEDRFSADLHIIKTAGEREVRETSPGRTYIHPPRRTEQPMNTPVARKLAAADARRVAAARAARAAAASRRVAAAKRRVLLLAVLGVLTIGGWVAAVWAPVPWAVPAVLTAVTIGVVELGRRAAAAGVRADAELARRVREAEARAGLTPAPAEEPPAAEPAPADLAEDAAGQQAEREEPSLRVEVDPGKQEDSTWTPVPVPPPAYTLKATVRRKIAEPEELAEKAAEASLNAAPTAEGAAPAEAGSPAVETPAPEAPELETPAPETPASETPGGEAPAETPAPAKPAGEAVNVQEILARRRAVG